MLTVANLLARYAALEPAARPEKRRRSPVGEPVVVHDVTLPSRPLRSLTCAANVPAVVVETICARPQLVERIDLLRPDADLRLARYALAADRY